MSNTEEAIVNLRQAATQSITDYFEAIGNAEVTNLHDMFLEQIEPPILQAVIERAKYNQSRAAEILGISRGTLRKKLKKYFGDKYCGVRDAI